MGCALQKNHVVEPFLFEDRVINARRRRLERYPLQVKHKQDWGRGFILLLPQTAALPESDAGSGVIKPASSFVIQNRQTSYSICIGHAVSIWSAVCSEASHSQFGEGARPHLCIRHAVSTWSAVCSEASHSQFGEGARPFVHGRMESPNTSPQAVELNPNCSG